MKKFYILVLMTSLSANLASANCVQYNKLISIDAHTGQLTRPKIACGHDCFVTQTWEKTWTGIEYLHERVQCDGNYKEYDAGDE